MRRIVLIALLSLFSIGLIANNEVKKDKKKLEKITFTVNMDCHKCEAKIKDNISYEKGVKDLKVSLEDLECTITYRKDKTNEIKLKKAFEKLGYEAKVKPLENKQEKQNQEK